MADYSKAFSPSFKTNTFTTETIPGIDYKSAGKFNLSNIDFNKASSLTFNPIAFDPSVNLAGGNSQAGWTFITAPEDISWDVNNQANRIDIFGTNNPPVVSGSRGMRDLTLGNSLVEGFIRNVTVEDKIAALEDLMNYKINQTDGFVSVPVYQIWANEKAYGNGYFIIRDIRVKESMRDLKGNATRAHVDITLLEVPEYQVNSGRDQATSATAGARSAFISAAQKTGTTGSVAATAAGASVDKNVNQTNKAGPTAPSKKTSPSITPRSGNARFAPLPIQ
jgi:hypothetical protein